MVSVMPTGSIHPKSTYVLGVDLNRKGKDSTAFVVLENPFNSDGIFLVYVEVKNYDSLTQPIGRILFLNSLFNFKKIYIDTTGLGGGVTDVLTEKLGSGIVEEVIFTRISKPHMFNNLRLLMQQQKIYFPNYLTTKKEEHKKLYFQFLSINQAFSSDSEMPKISHQPRTHDDIICALALASLEFQPKNTISRSYSLVGVNR
jgi:phage FluMu gp28-like protein